MRLKPRKPKPDRQRTRAVFSKRTDPLHEKGNVLRWGMPETKISDMMTATVWRTICNRYMVARVLSVYSDDHRFMAFRTERSELASTKRVQYHDISLTIDMGGRPKSYRDLYGAMNKVREYHEEKMGSPIVSNDDTILGHAADHDLVEIPTAVKKRATRRAYAAADVSAIQPLSESIMSTTIKIPASEMVAFFEDAGFPKACDYDLDKLQNKTANIPDYDEIPIKTDESKTLLNRILSATKAKKKIVVEEDRPAFIEKADKKAKDKKRNPAVEPEAKKSEKTSKAEAKVAAKIKGKKDAKAAKAKPAKESTVKRDDWGTKMGTTAQKWNAALTSKPQSMGELMKRAKISCTRYPHSEKMIAAGYVVKDKENKFRLKK